MKTRARFDPSLRSTADFRDWFADSRTIDRLGRPRILYHGTVAAFDEFDPATVGRRHIDWELGPAFYFTTSPKSASAYATSLWSSADGKTPADNACVMPVFLKMTNPLVEDVESMPAFDWVPSLIEQAKERGHDGVIAIDVDDGVIDTQYVVFAPDQIRSIYSFAPQPQSAKDNRR